MNRRDELAREQAANDQTSLALMKATGAARYQQDEKFAPRVYLSLWFTSSVSQTYNVVESLAYGMSQALAVPQDARQEQLCDGVRVTQHRRRS